MKFSSSASSSNHIRNSHHRGRFHDDEEEDGNIDNDDDGPDEVPIVMGSCLFFTDHQNNTRYNNNSMPSCTEFYGDTDVWDNEKMVKYCSLKYNSILTIEEECPKCSLLSEFEIIVGWCHVEEMKKGNGTLIEMTPMVTITSPTNNSSDNQRECESVMGGIFKTASKCTTTTTTTTSITSSSNTSTTTKINDIDTIEGDSPLQPIKIVEYDHGCDESKCVSTGLAGEYFNDSFTCYTNNDHPMMCADGYQPKIVENEATVYSDWYNNYFHYFTCCPPTLLFDPNTRVRHCSNTTAFGGLNNTMICDNNDHPYPRQMKNSTVYWDDEVAGSYICCDSTINTNDNQTTNFLNITECVPYKNKNYVRSSISGNYYGEIYVNTCNNSEIGFKHRNKHGECCKTKQKTYSFIPDSQFKATVYPQIILSSIAVIACTILIVALLIPLWLHWRVQSAAANVPVNITRAANTRLQQAAAASTYSSYNLYLVFLAIPDLLLNLYLLIMYGSYANQKYNPTFNGIIIVTWYDPDGIVSEFEPSFVLAFSTANLYLNCIVSYEMLVLLRNNNQVITHKPPSLSKVFLQAVGIYLFSIIVFLVHYIIGREMIEAEQQYNVTHNDDDLRKFGILYHANLIWSLVVTYIFPIGFFSYIWITIKCRGYMPSVTDSTKQLVWFFRRIVFVFCLIWVPGMGLIVSGTNHEQWQIDGWKIQIGLLFCGLQPIVSTCMAMTKADVRKNTLKVVRLSYIRTSLSSSVSYIRTSLASSTFYFRTSQ